MSKTQNTDSETRVLEALTTVFQTHGFGGATLTLFTEATGLKRPSLYHRFPGGKLGMALAVVDFAKERFVGEVLAPLMREGDPRKRVKETAKNMKEFYDGGNDACLMDALSVGAKGTDRQAIDEAIAEMFGDFVDAMTHVAKDFGASKVAARRLGEDAVVRLEGSLVVARGMGDTSVFSRVLRELPDLLAGTTK